MSKYAMIAGVALLTLALFWKPIQEMLNGLVGGGGGFDGQNYSPRDFSTNQGPAYDPPNTVTTTTTEETKTPAGVVLDTGDGIVNTAPPIVGDSTPIGENPNNDEGWKDYLSKPEGIFTAAWAIPTAGTAIYSVGKYTYPKANKVLKETAPKLKEVLKKAAPKAAELGKKAIKSPVAKGAAIVAVVTLASSDKGVFGIGDFLTNYVTNPLIKLGDSVGMKPAPQSSNRGGSTPSAPYNPGGSIKSSNSSNATTTSLKTSGSGVWSTSPGGDGMPSAGTKVYLDKGQDLSNFKKPPPPPPPPSPPKGGKKK